MNRTCPVDESEFRASAASLSAMTGVPIIVQKYGGTSVADTDRITRVADRIARTKRAGNNVVVAVSAMGKTTDQLIRQAEEISPHPPGREMDMLLTAGERISMALLPEERTPTKADWARISRGWRSRLDAEIAAL